MALLIEKDTICALSTANGVGAIAVIRVSGEEALILTSKIFSKDLTKVDSHTVHFGTIRDQENNVIDEVLVTVLKEGKSFTGESTTEIACHGSTFIQQLILSLLFKAGIEWRNQENSPCVPISTDEWTYRKRKRLLI